MTEDFSMNFIPNDEVGGSLQSFAGDGTGHNDMTALKASGETLNLLTDSMGKLNDIMNKVIESFKVFNQQLEQNNQRTNPNNPNNSNSNNFFQKNPIARQGLSAFTGGIGMAASIDAAVESYRQSYATGDIMGAKANAWKSGGSVAQGLGGTLLSTGAMLGATPVGWGFMAAGGGLELLGLGANMVGNHKQTEKTQAEVYESMLPAMGKFLASYGDSYLGDREIYGFNERGNSIRKNSVYQDLRNISGNRIQANTNDNLAIDFIDAITKSDLINTGLDASQYLNYMSSLRKYGVEGYNNASQMTKIAAQTSKAWGGNLETELDYMGTVERYNGQGAGISAFGKALDIEKLKIDKGQLDEILQGISSSIEDGVAKGYTRNAEELTDTLAMFAQASGGSQFWTGKNGVARLQQMQSGMASMSGMDSTESMLVYRAVDSVIDGNYAGYLGEGNYLKGGSYLNTMAAIEKGDVGKDMLNSIFSGLNNTYNGDTNSIVESIKKIFGLNTAGAIQLYNMQGNFTDTTLTNMMKNPELTDGETQKANVLNEIKAETVRAGKDVNEIWKKTELIAGDLGTIVKRQSFNDMISYLENQSELAGLGGLKTTLLPQLQKDAIKGENYEEWSNFIQNYYANKTQVNNAMLLRPDLTNGYFNFKVTDDTRGLYNGWTTNSLGVIGSSADGAKTGQVGASVAQWFKATYASQLSGYKDEEILTALARGNLDKNSNGYISLQEMLSVLNEIRETMTSGIAIY